jgi:hypothetical protein
MWALHRKEAERVLNSIKEVGDIHSTPALQPACSSVPQNYFATGSIEYCNAAKEWARCNARTEDTESAITWDRHIRCHYASSLEMMALDDQVDIMDLGNHLHVPDHLTSTSRRMLPEVQVAMTKAFQITCADIGIEIDPNMNRRCLSLEG